MKIIFCIILFSSFCTSTISAQDTSSYKVVFHLPIDSVFISFDSNPIKYHSGDTLFIRNSSTFIQFIWFNKFYHSEAFTLSKKMVNKFTVKNSFGNTNLNEHQRKLAKLYWQSAGVVITDSTTKIYLNDEYIGSGVAFFKENIGTIKLVENDAKPFILKVNPNEPYFEKIEYFFRAPKRENWQLLVPGMVQYQRRDFGKTILAGALTGLSISSAFAYALKYNTTKTQHDLDYKLYINATSPHEAEKQRNRVKKLRSDLDDLSTSVYSSLAVLSATYILNYLDWEFNEPKLTQPKYKFNPFVQINTQSVNNNIVPQLGISLKF